MTNETEPEEEGGERGGGVGGREREQTQTDNER